MYPVGIFIIIPHPSSQVVGVVKLPFAESLEEIKLVAHNKGREISGIVFCTHQIMIRGALETLPAKLMLPILKTRYDKC